VCMPPGIVRHVYGQKRMGLIDVDISVSRIWGSNP
jgi:hypothetical protein